MKELKKLCFHGGCPDEKAIRSRCWKYLLDYLGPKKSEHQAYLKKKRGLYYDYLHTFLTEAVPSGDATEVIDHPLNPGNNSQWKTYFSDNEVLMQIDRDCRRIAPDLGFFQMCTDQRNLKYTQLLRLRIQNAQLSSETVVRDRMGLSTLNKKAQRSSSLTDSDEVNWEVVERILFVFYKLNPGQGYVQGMNEVLGPLFYVFANDPEMDWREHAEEDAFYCFTNLMGEIRDCFIRSLDESESGIRGQMANFTELLRSVDVHIFTILEEQRIQPQYFAFRWLR